MSFFSFLKKWIVFAITLALMIVINLLTINDFANSSYIESNITRGLCIGVPFVEANLCAAWIALMPLRFTKRLISVVPVFLLAIAAMASSVGSTLELALGIALAVHFLLVQTPLWMARRAGWLLSDDVEIHMNGEPSGNATQYGVRHLMIWTAIVAVCMGLGRAVMQITPEFNHPGSHEFVVGASLVVTANLIVFPALWGSFVNRRIALWCTVTVLWASLLTFGELFALGKMLGITPESSDIVTIVGLNTTQALATFAVCLSIRLAGYRLVRLGHGD